jgi:predicted nucleic acid-binding protein
MILLDTNVVSELMRARPHKSVLEWLDSQPWDTLYLCAPVLAELLYGIDRLPNGRRKDLFVEALTRIETELYGGRVLSFDQSAAAHYARLTVARERRGHRMQQMDALIAAIAATHGASIATRDMRGFASLGLDLINPFEAKAAR